jgi:hypothetical protein
MIVAVEPTARFSQWLNIVVIDMDIYPTFEDWGKALGIEPAEVKGWIGHFDNQENLLFGFPSSDVFSSIRCLLINGNDEERAVWDQIKDVPLKELITPCPNPDYYTADHYALESLRDAFLQLMASLPVDKQSQAYTKCADILYKLL